MSERRWVTLNRDRRCSNRGCQRTLETGTTALRMPATRMGERFGLVDVIVWYCEDCAEKFHLVPEPATDDDE